MRFFDHTLWLGLPGLMAWAFYLLMLIFVERIDANIWRFNRVLGGLLVAAIGVASTVVPMSIAVQQLASIGGFIVLAYPGMLIWKRLMYQAIERIAILGVEFGLLGSVSTKLMVLGGGLPYFCHILADMLVCVGIYSLHHLNKEELKRERTDTA